MQFVWMHSIAFYMLMHERTEIFFADIDSGHILWHNQRNLKIVSRFFLDLAL